MTEWKAGMKAECISDRGWCDPHFKHGSTDGPALGSQHTVTGVHTKTARHWPEPCLCLELNTWPGGWCFNASAFRPVVEDKAAAENKVQEHFGKYLKELVESE